MNAKCEECGDYLDAFGYCEDENCVNAAEICFTCNYAPCACDSIFDAWRDSLLD